MARAVRGEMNRLGKPSASILGGRRVVGLDPSTPNGGPGTEGGEGMPAALPKIAEKADDLEAEQHRRLATDR